MKKLRKGEVRFVERCIDKLWRVYDRSQGSYPYQTGELGEVVQDVTELEAKAECTRLNDKFVGEGASAPKAAPATMGTKKAKKAPASVAPPVSEELVVIDLPDYGDLRHETDKHIDWK